MEGEGRKEEENYFKQWLLKIFPNFCHKTTDQENSWSVKTNKWQKVMNTEVFIFKYRKWEMKEILRAAKSNFSSEINKMTNLVWILIVFQEEIINLMCMLLKYHSFLNFGMLHKFSEHPWAGATLTFTVLLWFQDICWRN